MNQRPPKTVVSDRIDPATGTFECPVLWVKDTCPGHGRWEHYFIHMQSVCKVDKCLGYEHDHVPEDNSKENPAPGDFFSRKGNPRLCFSCRFSLTMEYTPEYDQNDPTCKEIRQIQQDETLSNSEKWKLVYPLMSWLEVKVSDSFLRKGEQPDRFGR